MGGAVMRALIIILCALPPLAIIATLTQAPRYIPTVIAVQPPR